MGWISMQWTSVLAIYVLFWALTAFVLLPFGIRAASDQGVDPEDRIPGQADSAPVNFRPGRLILRATIIAAILCALYIANYEAGWITASDLDMTQYLLPEGKR